LGVGYGEESEKGKGSEESQEREEDKERKEAQESGKENNLSPACAGCVGNARDRSETEIRVHMKLQAYRETYYTYTGKVSDICRPLGLAGIAILWIFKTESGGQFSVPRELMWPGLLIVAGLAADLLQYLVGSIIWFLFYRVKEYQGVNEETDLAHGIFLEAPIHLLFWAKAILIAVAYYYIFLFFLHAVSFK